VPRSGEGVFVKPPGRRARTLAGEDAAPRDLAMHGGTVYWTEGGTARSAGLPGVKGGEVRRGDAARRTVYWTRDGKPEVYRVRVPPPDQASVARSVSKPG
jgi:hypothetical protein